MINPMRFPFKLTSFRARLTIQWSIVFGIVIALTLLGIYISVKYRLESELKAELRTLASTEIASATDGNQGVHVHDFYHPAIINEHHIEKFSQILTPDGYVFRQSTGLLNREPLVSPAIIEKTLKGEAIMTQVKLDGVPGYGFSLFVEEKGNPYVFVVAVSVKHIETTLSTLRHNLAIAGLAALFATALVGYRLSTIALRPVDLMVRQARIIGLNHSSYRRERLEEPSTNDELYRLAKVLNEMLDRLYCLLESQQRFVADASHELRAPLTALRGHIEVVLRKERTPEQYRAMIEGCSEEVERLVQLTEDLLELARFDAKYLQLDLYEVDLEPLVREVVSQFTFPANTRYVLLSARIPANLTLIADPKLLRRLLANLVSNAIKYSKPEGGRVTISAGEDGAEIWIEVRDNGIGMDEEQVAHAFERFWRADKVRTVQKGGIGLGLAICQEIVLAHEGHIEITSTPGSGSCFRISFPAGLETESSSASFTPHEVGAGR
jgi:heavy metal sensor kinase